MKKNSRSGLDPAVLSLFGKTCERYGNAAISQALLSQDLATALKEAAPDPGNYDAAQSFAIDYLLGSLLRKHPSLPGSTPVRRKRAALQAWFGSEVRCASTNRAITRLLEGSCEITGIRLGEHTNVASVIMRSQQKILSVIGETPNLDRIIDRSRWSSGATFDKRRGTTLGEKVSALPSVTRGAYRLAAHALSEDYGWLRSLGIDAVGPCSPLECCFSIVPGNRMVLVDKNALVDRPICAEPTMNAFLQQGVGKTFRTALKRVGVTLDDQSKNQEFARIAQTFGFATLDLESASDSVAFLLVKLLLPEAWNTLLCALRSPATLWEGTWISLDKFSSMGNAFTFELESLIFWALAESVVELTRPGTFYRLTAVYGDDIVVPQECADTLCLVLELLGFKINTSKSFKRGRFFESCGKHYFDNQDVTPVYWDDDMTVYANRVRMHNSLVRWSMRTAGRWWTPVTRGLRDLLFDPKGPMVPFIDGDDGFFVRLKNLQAREDWQRGFRCWTLKARSGIMPAFEHEDGFYAYKLRKPSFSNTHPKGWCATEGKQLWVSGETWIPHWRVMDEAYVDFMTGAP